MLDQLKLHPFGVRAFLEKTTVLTFAAPSEELRAMLPPYLEPDIFQERWGFVAMAIVRTRQLRPSVLPGSLGQDFLLIGYRIFVRYTTSEGRRLRGLYILGSETDSRRMACLGNTFTHYNYTYKPMKVEVNQHRFALHATDGSTRVIVNEPTVDKITLPVGSVFKDWTEARRFVGPLPFTFSHSPRSKKVLIVEGSRMDWTPMPVVVEEYRSEFLGTLPLSDLRLSNAFTIDRVPYHWKAGILDQP